MDASIRLIEVIEQQSKEAPRSTKNSQKSRGLMLCLSILLLLVTRLSQPASFSFGLSKSIFDQARDSSMSQELEPTGGSMLRQKRTRGANTIVHTEEKRRTEQYVTPGP